MLLSGGTEEQAGWYFLKPGSTQPDGPVSRREIEQLLAGGSLSSHSAVWHPSFGSVWRTVAELEKTPNAAPPPITLPPIPPSVTPPPPKLPASSRWVPIDGSPDQHTSQDRLVGRSQAVRDAGARIQRETSAEKNASKIRLVGFAIFALAVVYGSNYVYELTRPSVYPSNSVQTSNPTQTVVSNAAPTLEDSIGIMTMEEFGGVFQCGDLETTFIKSPRLVTAAANAIVAGSISDNRSSFYENYGSDLAVIDPYGSYSLERCVAFGPAPKNSESYEIHGPGPYGSQMNCGVNYEIDRTTLVLSTYSFFRNANGDLDRRYAFSRQCKSLTPDAAKRHVLDILGKIRDKSVASAKQKKEKAEGRKI